MKIKLIGLILILLVCSISSFGDDEEYDPWTPKVFGGFGYFSAGMQEVDLDNLNFRLEQNGYDTFGNEFQMFGGGGYGIIGRLIIGGEGYGSINDTEIYSNNRLYKGRLSLGYGMFKIGYVFYSNQKWTLFSLFGIGGGGVSLYLRQNALPNFEGILTNPLRSSSLTNSFVILSVGVGGVLFYGPSNNGGFLMGFHAGYNHSFPIEGWYMDDQEITNGPDTGINGIYFHIFFGGGAIVRK